MTTPATTKTTTRKTAARPASTAGTPKTTTRRGARAKTGDPVADRAARDEAAKTAAAKATAPEPAAIKPTVQYVLTNGKIRVHKAGCKDIGRELAKSDYTEAPGLALDSQEAVIREIWGDHFGDHGEDQETAPVSFLHEHGYVGETDFAPCTKAILAPIEAAPAAPKVTRSDAKQDLGKRLVMAIADMLGSLDGSELALAGMNKDEAARCVSQWLHHIPTGQEDGKRYWPESMPRPDRSDWR